MITFAPYPDTLHAERPRLYWLPLVLLTTAALALTTHAPRLGAHVDHRHCPLRRLQVVDLAPHFRAAFIGGTGSCPSARARK